MSKVLEFWYLHQESTSEYGKFYAIWLCETDTGNYCVVSNYGAETTRNPGDDLMHERGQFSTSSYNAGSQAGANTYARRLASKKMNGGYSNVTTAMVRAGDLPPVYIQKRLGGGPTLTARPGEPQPAFTAPKPALKLTPAQRLAADAHMAISSGRPEIAVEKLGLLKALHAEATEAAATIKGDLEDVANHLRTILN